MILSLYLEHRTIVDEQYPACVAERLAVAGGKLDRPVLFLVINLIFKF